MSQLKKKYYQIRRQFRIDLHAAMKNNPAIAVAIIKTYRASSYMSHIGKIWWMMRNHPGFREEYHNELFGKILTGEDALFHSLYFAAPDIWQKYYRKIPEEFAMGDALGVSYRVLK